MNLSIAEDRLSNWHVCLEQLFKGDEPVGAKWNPVTARCGGARLCVCSICLWWIWAVEWKEHKSDVVMIPSMLILVMLESCGNRKGPALVTTVHMGERNASGKWPNMYHACRWPAGKIKVVDRPLSKNVHAHYNLRVCCGWRVLANT